MKMQFSGIHKTVALKNDSHAGAMKAPKLQSASVSRHRPLKYQRKERDLELETVLPQSM